MNKTYKFINALVIDPEKGTMLPGEVYVSGGRMGAPAPDARVVDLHGLAVAPGLVDMHVHFRDPGQTDKEDLLTGGAAAAAGGVTTAVCMANTSPPLDTPELVSGVIKRAAGAGITVLPAACVTESMAGGKLTDFASLRDAGAALLSDDGRPVTSAAVMLSALEKAEELGMLISAHSEDASLTDGRAVNLGWASETMRLPGRPAAAEEYMIARDALLAQTTGARVHIAHVSTALSVEIIRRAKERGVRISCETAPHYFTFTERDVPRLGTDGKMFPPLRTEKDRQAILAGLADGTIDAIATDHAPHTAEQKARGMLLAPGGVVGLETSLAASLTALYHSGLMTLPELFKRLSTGPAGLLGLECGRMSPGAPADLVIFDPDAAWECRPERFASKGRSTPFAGMELRGAVMATVKNGELIFAAVEV